MRKDQTVSVGGRALDILVALVERAGEVVSKQEIMERVWPNLIVEEANLRVHIANLRAVLDDGKAGNRYIVNVPGRGYIFIAPVERSIPVRASIDDQGVVPPMQKLPTRLARMIGREETIAALTSLLKTHRFVSIVGPGGMGKSTVAVEVANTMLDYFYDGVAFVDLGALADASLVADAIASAAGCFVKSHDPVASLLAFLSEKEILIVLDNCEHVIGTVAALSERIFRDSPQVHLLATSRETLRVEGENVYLLLPLDAPEPDRELKAAKALISPAVQLLMERAAAAGYRRKLDDTDAPFAAEICRRLDGIPLAIELVAGRAGVYGIRGIAKLLDDEFHLLWHGRRNALPRHQTLQAMLAWSYNLLSESERKILRHLSVFAGAFTPEAALWIAGNEDDEPDVVAGAVAGLVDKSLIWISTAGTKKLLYRLPDTTRRYVASKLAETGERSAVARQHALYYIYQLKHMEKAGGEDTPDCSAQLANVQGALEWSFSEAGDQVIGVQLAELAVPLFLRLSLLSECERWCARALEKLPEVNRGTKSELKLLEAFAISSMFTRGNSDEVRAAIQRGLDLAEVLNDRHHRLHLLAGLNIFHIRTGDFYTALTVAKGSTEVAKEIDHGSANAMVE